MAPSFVYSMQLAFPFYYMDVSLGCYQARKWIDVFHRTCLRIKMGVDQSECHMTNDQLYQTTGQMQISKEIRRRKLNFTGNCLRMKADKDQKLEPVNTYVLYKSTSGRRTGRPKRTYLWTKSSNTYCRIHTAEFILQDKKAKLSVDEITECAMHKKTWNDVIYFLY
jgi:hypothetical protein